MFHPDMGGIVVDNVSNVDRITTLHDVFKTLTYIGRVGTQEAMGAVGDSTLQELVLPGFAPLTEFGTVIPNQFVHYRSLFAQFRGSSRYTIVNGAPSGPMMARLDEQIQGTVTAGLALSPTVVSGSSPLVLCSTEYRAALEVEVPYTTPASVVPTRPLGRSLGLWQPAVHVNYTPRIAYDGTDFVQVSSLDVFAAFGDDAAFRFPRVVGPLQRVTEGTNREFGARGLSLQAGPARLTAP
jgi:hypothetical protein